GSDVCSSDLAAGEDHVVLLLVVVERLEHGADLVGRRVEPAGGVGGGAGGGVELREGDGVAPVEGGQPLAGDPLRFAAGADDRAQDRKSVVAAVQFVDAVGGA